MAFLSQGGEKNEAEVANFAATSEAFPFILCYICKYIFILLFNCLILSNDHVKSILRLRKI